MTRGLKQPKALNLPPEALNPDRSYQHRWSHRFDRIGYWPDRTGPETNKQTIVCHCLLSNLFFLVRTTTARKLSDVALFLSLSLSPPLPFFRWELVSVRGGGEEFHWTLSFTVSWEEGARAHQFLLLAAFHCRRMVEEAMEGSKEKVEDGALPGFSPATSTRIFWRSRKRSGPLHPLSLFLSRVAVIWCSWNWVEWIGPFPMLIQLSAKLFLFLP